MKTTMILAAFAGAALLPATALANPQPISVEVGFGDLNLLSDEGVDVLDRRLRHAVVDVCGGELPRVLTLASPMRQCRTETMENVIPARDDAIEAARSGKRGKVEIAKLTVTRRIPGAR